MYQDQRENQDHPDHGTVVISHNLNYVTMHECPDADANI